MYTGSLIEYNKTYKKVRNNCCSSKYIVISLLNFFL
nr:MAG TPA: hypothetical protein [Crassvirales sp.]